MHEKLSIPLTDTTGLTPRLRVGSTVIDPRTIRALGSDTLMRAAAGEVSMTSVDAAAVSALLGEIVTRGAPIDRISSDIAARLGDDTATATPDGVRRELADGVRRIADDVEQVLLERVAQDSEGPDEKDVITVQGHGQVHRGGRTRGVGGDRPHIYLWYEPVIDTGCEYQWYQFARIRVFVNQDRTQPASGWLLVPRLGGTRVGDGKRVTSAGGVTAVIGEFGNDAVRDRLEAANKARKRAGIAPFPRFTPPDLRRSSTDRSRPAGEVHVSRPVPGTDATPPALENDGVDRPPMPYQGLVDAPDFCTTNRKGAPYERIWLDIFGKRRRRADRRMHKRGSHTMRIEIDFRSYLVCIDGKRTECLGYVSWTYTHSTTVNYRWTTNGRVPQAGLIQMEQPVIVRPQSACTHSLRIGDWTACR